jgi:predicted nucleotidyltransferase
MEVKIFENFVQELLDWAKAEPEVVAALIVGSWARGTANRDSDIDIVLVCRNPLFYFDQQTWLAEFGDPESVTTEDYGLVQAVRAFYKDGKEVEFGLTSEEWLSEKEAQVTGKILAEGHRLLCDKLFLVARFCERHFKS